LGDWVLGQIPNPQSPIPTISLKILSSKIKIIKNKNY